MTTPAAWQEGRRGDRARLQGERPKSPRDHLDRDQGRARGAGLQVQLESESTRATRCNAQGLPAADISHSAIWNAYAEIDVSSNALGIKMGKNDLWIAATTLVVEGVVSTTDRDFDHLGPTGVKVERVLEVGEFIAIGDLAMMVQMFLSETAAGARRAGGRCN